MPVPQEINFLASQASCLLLAMVQHLSFNEVCSTKNPGKLQTNTKSQI
ncbi:hypothetical protein QUB70_24560 [Microcoleus sp. A003_D6]